MAFRSSAGLTGGNGASAVVPVPSGAAIGDIAVVGVYKENTAAITPPAGFTLKASMTTSGASRGTLYVYWKRLTAADSGTYSFTWSGSTWRSGVSCLHSGRLGSGDPFDGTVGTAESTSGVTTLNVSTSPANAAGDAIGIWTNFQGGNSYTPPTNYTERQDLDTITLDTRDNVASGSTGSISATSNVSGFQKAFLGVLQVAGGSDAAPAPAAVAATVAVPQAIPSASSTKTPAVTAGTMALPQPTPAVSDVAAPAATPATVSLPQPTISGNATVTPTPVSATLTAPQATPDTAAGASPSPAPVAGTLALPAAAPSGAATTTPNPTAAVAALLSATAHGAATAAPAVVAAAAAIHRPGVLVGAGPALVAAAVALPQASPLVGGSATATPAAVSAAVALAQAGVSVGAGPALVAVLGGVPQAIGAVSDSASPGVVQAAYGISQAATVTNAAVVVTPAAVAIILTVHDPAAGNLTVIVGNLFGPVADQLGGVARAAAVIPGAGTGRADDQIGQIVDTGDSLPGTIG